MSSTITSSSYYIESLGMTLDELSQVEDLEAYYQSLITTLTEDEIDELKTAIKSDFSNFDGDIYTLEKQLEDIISSDDSSPDAIYRAEYYLNKLTEFKELIDNFSSDWGNV